MSRERASSRSNMASKALDVKDSVSSYIAALMSGPNLMPKMAVSSFQAVNFNRDTVKEVKVCPSTVLLRRFPGTVT